MRHMSLIPNDKPSRERKRPGPVALTSLNDRHHEIIRLMVYGGDTGGRLNADQVAKTLRMRSAYVRALMLEPVFRSAFDAAVTAKRFSLKPKALDTLDSLLEAETEAVRLGASKAILDEPGSKGVNVSVQLNNQTNVSLRPGYVLDLSQSRRQAQTIEGNAE